MEQITQAVATERIILSLVAGAIIGLEREWRNKPAGLRTYALVCEGSALFMIVSIMLGEQMLALGQAYDPSRIASTVVQGIGFLAGGVIFTRQAMVRGLTTAAGIWVTAAVGLLIGAGFYFVAFAGIAASIFVLLPLGWVEQRLQNKVPNRDDDDLEAA